MDENKTILENITCPADVKNLSTAGVKKLSREIREVLIHTVAKNGGHLSSNLGVVELTLAIHKVFDTPHDQIVWDVGHQCYVHKLLTGRYRGFQTLRTEGGITGFPDPQESEHDSFIVGHSSTAVSAANGMAKAKSLTGDDGYVVAVLGDGALTGGLAYEGLSNAGRSHDRLIVILNDNQMSISKNVGFVARHLASLRARPHYVRFKTRFQRALQYIPLIGRPLCKLIVCAKCKLKNLVYRNSTLFEEMGFYYLGPLDGHDYNDLVNALETAKHINSPVIVHVDTVKGKGYPFAEQNPDVYHGVGGFDVESGITKPSSRTFSGVFGKAMCRAAEKNGRVCAITAAMKSGTGLSEFAEKFSSRCFDVGIAEEHAVTFASGLAQQGMIPVFAVYSTFLQRCFDQLVNDTSIINSHIVLAVDRAGIVPDDGVTHQGIFDVPLLNSIPHVTIFSPATFSELKIQLKQAVYDTKGIAVVRYPKGGQLPGMEEHLADKESFHLWEAEAPKALLVTYGRITGTARLAAEALAQKQMPVSVLKLNRIKPIDPRAVETAKEYAVVLFFEESSRAGGTGEAFGSLLSAEDFKGHYAIRAIEPFVGTCKVESGLHHAGLDQEGMMQFTESEVAREQSNEHN